LSPIATRNSSS